MDDLRARGPSPSPAAATVHPPSRSPLLHAEFPETGRLPFLPLLHGPTPLEEARGLEGYLGRGGVLVKRDDLSSPVYGGNKIRKYEYVLGEARARGASRLVTTGGLASTQVTATAVLGRALGFGVTAIFFDQPMTAFAERAILANQAAGVEAIYGGSYARSAWLAWREARAPGRHFILPGASTPLPNLGYIDAALELSDQFDRTGAPRPGAIVVPAGSCGTLVGLAIGLAYLGWDTDVIGVRITTRATCNAPFVWLVEAATRRFLRALSPRFRAARTRPPRALLFHGAAGAGYGEPTPDAVEGARRLESVTGYPGEVTYTGKAIAALRDIGRDPRYAKRPLLLWNTLTGAPPSTDGSDAARLPAGLRAALARPRVA